HAFEATHDDATGQGQPPALFSKPQGQTKRFRFSYQFRLWRARQRKQLLDLPYELLWHIMSFLSRTSLMDLMVNRALRSTCEDRLYERISFFSDYCRTLRLFETLRLRPDLALRVRHLEIDASHFDDFSHKLQRPDVLRSDGTNGLWMVPNLRSLTLTGLPRWICPSLRTGFLEAVSKMNLTHLGFECIQNVGHTRVQLEEWDRSFVEDVLAILRSQPSLETLTLDRCTIPISFVPNLAAQLLNSDVPILKRLTAPPDVATTFLNQISGLESITLNMEYYIHIPVVMGTPDKRASVRELTLRVYLDWDREQVSTVTALFPNVERLRGVKSCLDTITSTVTDVLPSIRYLEIMHKIDRDITVWTILVPWEGHISAYWDDGAQFEEIDEFLEEIKALCPQVEMIIEPKRSA
ncbi:hypothetical protein FRC01_009653, partial [Tulasnella sp. 417]